MIDLSYPNILDLFKEHLAPKRTESASFLIWYLENYYRLDTLEAVDAVCDQNGDKGVDGIYINEADNHIDIFQTRILRDPRCIPVQLGSRCKRLSVSRHNARHMLCWEDDPRVDIRFRQ